MTRETLGDRAYYALKDKIVTLESGTYLSARRFANDIGMSYTPVREAFLRLRREGSIRQVPNVGFFVETMDLSDLVQFFQVRECIEPFVLQKVISRIPPLQIQMMRDCVEKQNQALASGDIMQYMLMDITLHEVLLNLYGNQHLITLYHSIREKYMVCSKKVAVDYYPDAMSEHTSLIDSIEKRDIKRALKLLTNHIENAKQRMREGYINVTE
ncbi:MAG TPA: GntR family transcriptional regulator [Desulfosporosinus sp.]|nr:GntR family transcriptional regulator [Desulfosporosinus sp.]